MHRRAAYVGQIALLAAVYAVAGRLGLAADAVNGFASALWPPSGIALAVLLLGGTRLWPGVAVGAFAVNAWTGAPVLAAFAIAAGNTLEALLGAAALRAVGFRGSLLRIRDVLALTGAAAASTLVSPTVGVSALFAAGIVGDGSVALAWRTWWLGDATSELLLAPVILTFAASRLPRVLRPGRLAEAAALAAAVTAVSWFASAPLPPAFEPFQRAYVSFPLITWAAMRFGQRGVATAMLLFCSAAAWATALGHGPFVERDTHASLMGVQLFIALVAVTGLLLAAAMAERRRAEAEQARLAAIVENTDDAVVSMDLRGKILTWNAGSERLFGYGAAEVVGRSITLLLPPGRPDEEDQILGRLLAGERIDRHETQRRRKDGSLVDVSITVSPLRDVAGAIVGAAKIEHDITDRKRAEEALREADRRKDEFIGMLSHELRNPLAPIRNSVYLLDHAEPGSDRARRARAVIERQVSHLTRLVDDLLDVTRIARGKIELRRTRVDLNEVVRRAAEDHVALLRERGVALEVRVAGAPAWVDGDATRLAQIAGNLLLNAAKFTPRGGSATMEVRAGDEGCAEIRVRDTGAGIEPALVGKVFEPFVQGERTLARTQGGLGLGLALVKGLSELHGGSVEARSDGPGAGAEFVVRLPLAPGPAAAPEPGLPSRPAAASRHRVLVVEDNLDVAQSLAEIVEMFGHDVEIASDGPTALAKARARRPDVVLCDIGLPGMDGYQVARAFRSDPELYSARLVALTGYAQPDDVREARSAGFDRHIAKPPDPGEIERLLG